MTSEYGYLFRKNPGLIEAIWVIDSETGAECLINIRTSDIIAKRFNGHIVDPDAGKTDKTI